MCRMNVLEAKTNFSKLLSLLENREEDEIIICRNNKEVARITLIPQVDVSKRIGIAKGLVPHSWLALGTNYGMVRYDRSITVNTTPSINVHEYLPFREDIGIVRRRSETLHLAENLPRIDGAAAILPPRRYTPSPTGSRTTGTSAGWWSGCYLRKGNVL